MPKKTATPSGGSMLQPLGRQPRGSRTHRETRAQTNVPVRQNAASKRINQVMSELYLLANQTPPSLERWKVVCYAILIAHVSHYDLYRQLFDEYSTKLTVQRDLEIVKKIKNDLRGGKIGNLEAFMDRLPEHYLVANREGHTRYSRKFMLSFTQVLIDTVQNAGRNLVPVIALREYHETLRHAKRPQDLTELMSKRNLERIFLQVAA